jgi:hypothetical protein
MLDLIVVFVNIRNRKLMKLKGYVVILYNRDMMVSSALHDCVAFREGWRRH